MNPELAGERFVVENEVLLPAVLDCAGTRGTYGGDCIQRRGASLNQQASRHRARSAQSTQTVENDIPTVVEHPSKSRNDRPPATHELCIRNGSISDRCVNPLNTELCNLLREFC